MNNFADGISLTNFTIKNVSSKRINIFGRVITPGSSVNILNMPGIYEADIKTSLSKGVLYRKLIANEIIIVSTDLDLSTLNPSLYAILSAKGIPVSSLLSGSSSGSGLNAANITALKALSTTLVQDGSECFIDSIKQHFVWIVGDTTTTDNITVVDSTATPGLGRWVRESSINHPTWVNQATWNINGTSGNDENDGLTSGTPLKTMGEWFRRTGGKWAAFSTVMNLLAAPGDVGALANFPIYNVNNLGSTNAQFNIIGTPTVLDSGTLTSAFVDITGNVGATVADSSRANGYWTTFVGKWLLITSGGSSGKAYIIDADLASGGSVQITRGAVVTGGSGNPGVGATYQIVDAIPCMPLVFPINGSFSTNYRWIDFNASTGEKNWAARINFTGCRFRNTSFGFLERGFCTLCVFPAQVVGQVGSGPLNFSQSYFQAGAIAITNGPHLFFTECIARGTNAGFASSTDATSLNGGVISVVDCGFFALGGTNPAITASFMGRVQIRGKFYGSSVAKCIYLRGNSTCAVAKSGLSWTLVGTSLDIDMAGGPTQVPPLVGGTTVPAAANCTTQAQWNSSPFSFMVTSQTDGSILVGV